MTDASVPLLSLAVEQYVLLVTTRRSGVDVATPVWVGRDGDALVVTTARDAGKTKRIRHTPRVTLQACDRVGNPRLGAPVVEGHATVDESPEGRERLVALFKAKYGAQYLAILGLQKLRGTTDRSVTLRITAPVASVGHPAE